MKKSLIILLFVLGCASQPFIYVESNGAEGYIVPKEYMVSLGGTDFFEPNIDDINSFEQSIPNYLSDWNKVLFSDRTMTSMQKDGFVDFEELTLEILNKRFIRQYIGLPDGDVTGLVCAKR